MSKIQSLVHEFRTPHVCLTVTLDDENKKQYKGLRKGYNTCTYEECCLTPFSLSCNQILLRVPDNFIVIDTDSDETYNVLKQYLKEKGIYNKACVTKSFSNKALGQKYKNHFCFWLRKRTEMSIIASSINRSI